MNESLIIAVDFDGTCVTHEFPRIGRDIQAAPVLRALVKSGHRIILWTMRSNVKEPISTDDNISAVPGDYLDQAVNWFKANDIELWGINENPEQKSWTHSPKAYANMYIDDAGVGVPLHRTGDVARPFVDWNKLSEFFVHNQIITSIDDRDL